MALSVPTSLATAVFTTTQVAMTTASFTPTPNSLVVVLAGGYTNAGTAPVTLSITDTLGGYKWAKVEGVDGVTGNVTTATIFFAVAPANPTAGTITVTPSTTGASGSGYFTQPWQITGGARAYPVAAAGNSSTATVTFNTAPATTSEVIALGVSGNASDPGTTQPTGLTALFTDSHAGGTSTYVTGGYRNGSSPASSYTWASLPNPASAAIEIVLPSTSSAAAIPTYRYLIDDAITGNHLAEVNLDNVRYSYGINGSGSFSASMPMADPDCTSTNLKTLARDVLVLRNDQPVFNGPITGLQSDSASKIVNITASPMWWWMGSRTIELSRSYVVADLAAVVNDLIATTNGKFAGVIRMTPSGWYNAGTGQYVSQSYDAAARKNVAQAIEDLARIYPGFDFDVALRVDPSTGKCLREYNIYNPFMGVTVDQALTEKNLIQFTQNDDGTRVYNRVHELGTGSGDTQLLYSQSGYQTSAYFNNGVNDSPPVSGGSGATITSDNGYPVPAWQFINNSYKGWTANHGVGSFIDFDFFALNSSLTTTYGGSQDGSYFYFGCNSSGAGNAYSLWSHYDATTDRQAVLTTTAWGSAVTAQANIKRSGAAPIASNMWHHATIQIVTSTTARLWVDGRQLFSYNATSGLCDGDTFAITLNGTYFGIWESGSQAVYYDNISVTQPTSTYTLPSIPYIERVYNRSDVGDIRSLQLYAQADLYLGTWPSLTYTAQFKPSASLPFGFCNPGDTVPINFQGGNYLAVAGNKRVILIDVTVDSSGGEVVSLTFNDPHA